MARRALVALAAMLAACGPAGSTATPASQSAGASGTPTPTEAASPGVALSDLSGQFVFGRAGQTFGDETAFIANADGSDERQITRTEVGGPLRVSSDHTRLLVNLGPPESGPHTGATVLIADGTLERLPAPDPTLNLAPLAWSTDGNWIAFEGWEDADPSRNGLYTARFPGLTDLKRLTTAPDGMLDSPADWSNVGQIAFFRHASGPNWDQGGELWVVRANDGGGLQRLVTPNVSPSWWARWSPDASTLLFGAARLSSQGALWTIKADGSNPTQIFEDADGRFPITPAWSPDGRHVMFSLDPTNDEFQHPPNELYVARSDGSGLTRVLGGSDFKRDVEWFPSEVPEIAGSWHRAQACEEVTAVFEAAALAESHGGWLEGVCVGVSGPIEHSHFFTTLGRFGSRDELGNQVDYGNYCVVDTDTLAFPGDAPCGSAGAVEVGYAIEGDLVTFEVSLPSSCDASCKDGYAWALSAFASGPWARGEVP